VRAKVTEGTSGLFLLLGAVTTDKVVEAFKAAPHFEIVASNLTHEQEQKLKDAFARARARWRSWRRATSALRHWRRKPDRAVDPGAGSLRRAPGGINNGIAILGNPTCPFGQSNCPLVQ
jgi:hypothetical protein